MSNTPAINFATLPAGQRAAVEALMQEVCALKEITKRQEHLIAELNHALHGKRSERLTEDERQLAFEDLTIALKEVEAEKETRATSQGDGTRKKPAPRRNIGNPNRYRERSSPKPHRRPAALELQAVKLTAR
jgi:hypothetical protein